MNESPYNSVKDDRFRSLVQWLKDNDINYQHLSVASVDAGFRRYFRLHWDDFTRIAVDAPPDFEDTRAFVEIAARLSGSGLHTPFIHCYSLEKGFLVVEDLGQSHLQHALAKAGAKPAVAHKKYSDAMQIILQMQKRTDTGGLPIYDKEFITTELEIFVQWYLQHHLGHTIDPASRATINSAFETLSNNIVEQPQAFMHRDFHCRNLMVLDNNDLGIIDFQGAMLGPITYDPVSLLRDVYQQWPHDFQEALIEQHRTAIEPPIHKETYQRWFDLTGLQRHLKILGIFCRLCYRDNKSDYLEHLPTVRNQVHTTLNAYSELSDFLKLFEHLHEDQNTK